MATQDFVDFSEGDGDEDEVQAILAALQSRKEKQQKLKKAIRDKANKSQKLLKDECEGASSKEAEVFSKITILETEMQGFVDKLATLAPVVSTRTNAEDSEIIESRRALYELGKTLLYQAADHETFIKKRVAKVASRMAAEAKRSRNEDILRAMTDISQEVAKGIQTLKGK